MKRVEAKKRVKQHFSYSWPKSDHIVISFGNVPQEVYSALDRYDTIFFAREVFKVISKHPVSIVSLKRLWILNLFPKRYRLVLYYPGFTDINQI